MLGFLLGGGALKLGSGWAAAAQSIRLRAVGVRMGREGIDAVAAFNKLRDVARSSERKVADVAAQLLARIPGNLP